MENFTVFKVQNDVNDKNGSVAITYFKPYIQTERCAIIIFAGGGYSHKCEYEGEAYAEFLASYGIPAFVVDYRVSPNCFPCELIDARQSVRFVRKNAEKFDIDKDKILVMGSSAGAHLSALVSTYFDKIEGEENLENYNESYLPNGQIICYPVITSDKGITHEGSYVNLLGEKVEELRDKVSPEKIASNLTPKAFIWHTFEDEEVNVMNSMLYAQKLNKLGVPCEMHIYQNGHHGLNLANHLPNIATWKQLLINWLKLNKFVEKQ